MDYGSQTALIFVTSLPNGASGDLQSMLIVPCGELLLGFLGGGLPR